MGADPVRLMSTASYLETAIVIETRFGEPGGQRWICGCTAPRLILSTVDSNQADAARAAYRMFGKGRHRATSFTATASPTPSLRSAASLCSLKGDDFAHTDIRVVPAG